MPSKILFEGYNLGLKRGTGIATYTRNLNIAARAAGYSTEALLNLQTPLVRGDPILSEVSLSDAGVTPASKLAQHLRAIRGQLVGYPLGIKAAELQRTGAVVDDAPANVTGFDKTYGAVGFSDASRSHFMRYGRRARLNLPAPAALFHATHPIPLFSPGRPNIYTVHDIIPLKLPFATLDNKKYFLEMLRHLCKVADHIVTVSEHSRQDILRLFSLDENRITNTYQAVQVPQHLLDVELDDSVSAVESEYQLEYEGYFLFVGAIEPKKNLSRLIDAYARSGTSRPLVIAGGYGWQYKEEAEKIQQERFLRYRVSGRNIIPQRQVLHLSHVPLEQLVALIRGARAVLAPSLYEGFGLPVLEAMQLGAPVMTSNVASLPEISGDAALLINPLDTDDMARAIKTLDSDSELRQQMRTRGRARAAIFSSENYRERVAQLYRRFIN